MTPAVPTSESESVLAFRVTLEEAVGTEVTVDYATGVDPAAASGGSASARGDYTAVTSGRLTIPANSEHADIEIALVNDEIAEGDETFAVTLSNASSNAVIETATAIGTTTTARHRRLATGAAAGPRAD